MKHAPIQKFECEHCEKVSADVYYDDDFGGALCNKCIATKDEWFKDEAEEYAITEMEAVCIAVLIHRGGKINEDAIAAAMTQFKTVYELNKPAWHVVYVNLAARFL